MSMFKKEVSSVFYYEDMSHTFETETETLLVIVI